MAFSAQDVRYRKARVGILIDNCGLLAYLELTTYTFKKLTIVLGNWSSTPFIESMPCLLPCSCCTKI